MCTALSANLATAHQGHHSIVLRAPTDWAHSRIAQSYNSDDSYAILQLFMCEPPTRLLLVEKRWFMSISNLINFKYCAGNATFFNSLDGSFSRVIVSVIPAVFLYQSQIYQSPVGVQRSFHFVSPLFVH